MNKHGLYTVIYDAEKVREEMNSWGNLKFPEIKFKMDEILNLVQRLAKAVLEGDKNGIQDT